VRLPVSIEQQSQARVDLLVRVKYNRSIWMVGQSDGQREFELATSRLVAHPTLQPRVQNVQLSLAHGSLQTEQQASLK
jgi:hypothetical protein